MAEEIDGMGDKGSGDTTTLAHILLTCLCDMCILLMKFFFFCVTKQNYDLGTTLFKNWISRLLYVRLKEFYCVLALYENGEF